MKLNDDNIEIFKYDASQFHKIDSEIKKINKFIKPYQNRVKKLKLERTNLEKVICSVMSNNELIQAQLPDDAGILEYKISKRVIPATQNFIKESIVDFFNNGPGSSEKFSKYSASEKSDILIDYIYSNRAYNTKEIIKAVEF